MTEPTRVSTGLIDTNTQVATGRGIFGGVNVDTGKVEIYDGTDNTGKLIFQGEDDFETHPGIRFTEGLYVDVETGTAEVVVYHGA